MTVKLSYHLVNVFTRDGGRLTGNPLCVFEPGPALEATLMQALARQFNLSETTFLSHSSRATMAVRIFTPDFEMPFAGHPTLGSAHVVRRLSSADGGDHVVLEMRAGLIPVEARGDRWTLTANAPVHREIQRDAAWLADALGLQVSDLRWQSHGARPLWVDTGSDQLIVPLASVEAVRRIVPRIDAFDTLRSSAGRRMVLVFAEAGDGRCESRFLFEHDGAFVEDPATGSACANLGGWYLAVGEKGVGESLPLVREIHQGDRVHRPSTLRLSVGDDRSIRVGGDVTYLGRGEIDV
jgi:trans-2,3-dihydro-3-hydroxyanthranilate isomerase